MLRLYGIFPGRVKQSRTRQVFVDSGRQHSVGAVVAVDARRGGAAQARQRFQRMVRGHSPVHSAFSYSFGMSKAPLERVELQGATRRGIGTQEGRVAGGSSHPERLHIRV